MLLSSARTHSRLVLRFRSLHYAMLLLAVRWRLARSECRWPDATLLRSPAGPAAADSHCTPSHIARGQHCRHLLYCYNVCGFCGCRWMRSLVSSTVEVRGGPFLLSEHSSKPLAGHNSVRKCLLALLPTPAALTPHGPSDMRSSERAARDAHEDGTAAASTVVASRWMAAPISRARGNWLDGTVDRPSS